MTRSTLAAVLLLAAIAAGGCQPHHGYYDRGHRDSYGRHEMDDRDAWEIVRRDPCRYDEYRRYASEHKNPEKRRRVVWRLAREGCSSERAYESNRPGYDYNDR